MRRYSALVPQDDLLTPTLTVHESLMEAALFKSGLGVVARQDRVEKLLEQFGLSGCRDVRIGHPDGKKGISGGQRRRLSVALELSGTVSLLYLDEPTSGLDAVSTMALVRLLSSLARGTPPPVGPRTVGPPPAPSGPRPASLGPPTLPPLRPHPAAPQAPPLPPQAASRSSRPSTSRLPRPSSALTGCCCCTRGASPTRGPSPSDSSRWPTSRRQARVHARHGTARHGTRHCTRQ